MDLQNLWTGLGSLRVLDLPVGVIGQVPYVQHGKPWARLRKESARRRKGAPSLRSRSDGDVQTRGTIEIISSKQEHAGDRACIHVHVDDNIQSSS